MILTRQEKEKLILDLYNQDKTYKQIAQTARISLRDIKPVLEKAEKEREKELGINTQEGTTTVLETKTKLKRPLPSVKHIDYFRKVRHHWMLQSN
jgi:predicted transcriptional regulator